MEAAFVVSTTDLLIYRIVCIVKVVVHIHNLEMKKKVRFHTPCLRNDTLDNEFSYF